MGQMQFFCWQEVWNCVFLFSKPLIQRIKYIYYDLLSLLTLEELIQGMVSITYYQHRTIAKNTSPKFLIGQQSLSDLKANVGFSWEN